MTESVARRGVISANRPPAISQHTQTGSEDTVVLSVDVFWEKDLFETLTCVFDDLKTAAQNGDHDNDHLTLDGKLFLVAPTGHKSTGPMYRWRLLCDGVTISIARQHAPQKEVPNVLIHVGSLYLMKNGGLLTAWPDIEAMLAAFQGKIEVVKLSRLDGCVDLADIDVSEYVRRYETNCFISKSRKGGVFNDGKRKTGFKLGTGKQIRVYDKRLEVEHQPEKMLILIQTRWGGRYPACATRVEFQVGSEGLRDLGIVTLDDYEKKRSSLFHYLTHDWFRMTDTVPKDNHHSRIETAAVWTTVQETFAAWTGQAPRSLVHKVDTLPDYGQLAKQAIGCIGSIVALKDITFDDEDALRHHLKAEMWNMLNKEDMALILKQIEHKRIRFNALGRVFH